ncbi:MAG TPA: AMP-binding protein [Acidimicrobiia bacterium]|nr:AMP-binding protein [Acidimicrobiia bacterium]
MALTGVEPFDDLDRLSPEGLEGWWATRLAEVLAVAAQEVEFHRRRFAAAGFDPAAFKGLDDLTAVPIMRKADVLAAQRAGGALAAGIERLGATPGRIVTMSSGTSGTSFLRWPREWREVQGASSLRAHWWVGLRPGTPFLLVAPGWHVYAAVQSYIVEQLGLPGVVVSGTYLPRFSDRILEAVRRFRPRFLILFLPMVFSLLAEGRRQGLAAADVFGSVERLVVTGAPMTAGLRDHLRAVTGAARVIELAGSSENLLAAECGAAPGLHVVPDTCHVQVLDPDGGRAGDGERGRVVHTTMVPWGSMYIRYDGGDIGTLDTRPCRCGLPSPRLKILGRAEHEFVLAGRRWLPYDVQAAIEEEVPELAGATFAITTEGLAAGRLRLLLEPPDGGSVPALEEVLTRRLRARFGVEVELRFPRTLPLMMKGVVPVISEREVAR